MLHVHTAELTLAGINTELIINALLMQSVYTTLTPTHVKSTRYHFI